MNRAVQLKQLSWAMFAMGTSLALIASGMTLAVIVTSCKTSQKTLAYKTLAVVAQTVDASLKSYADLVVAGKVDQETQVKVADAKGRYEIAFKAAVAAARGNLQSPTPDDVQKLADNLSTLLGAVLKQHG